MKEHAFFLEAAFTPKDQNMVTQARFFQSAFGALLADAVALSGGVVNDDVLRSGEVITPFTLRAEQATSFYTGAQFQTSLTQAEAALVGGGMTVSPQLEQRVDALNARAVNLLTGIIDFKTAILTDVLSCTMFTMNYPLLIDHILREAKLYLILVQRLQNREDFNMEREAFEQELFWNRIMAEHSKFIRGLLDPTENDLIMTANNFGNEFDQLTAQVEQAMNRTIPLKRVTAESLQSTKELRDFKVQGTQGILECKVRSVILPLLGDHVLREANHYLRLLNLFEKAV